MKKFINKVACLTLVTTMFLSSTSYVYAYTTEQLLAIRDNAETTILYAIGNPDLEYYISKSDAEKTSKNIITYSTQNEYKTAGTNEGRRAGIKAGVDEFYEGKFPKMSDATNSLSKKSDSEILKENKISETDGNKDVFLASYKENYLDAYSVANYELAGYYFGEVYAQKDLIRYDLYNPKPVVSDVYKIAKKDLFTSYGVASSDTYANVFESGYAKGYELTYTKEDSNADIVYKIGKTVGYEKAKEIKGKLESFQDLQTEIDTYKGSSAYRIEQTKYLDGFNGASDYSELQTKFDEGFDEGAKRVVDGSTSSDEEVSDIQNAGKGHGSDIGGMAGEAYAKSDFINNKPLDVVAAYNDYISSVDFSQRYKLYLMPYSYSVGFAEGLQESFIGRYNGMYIELKDGTIQASQFVQLPTNGDLVTPYQIKADSKNLDVEFIVDVGYGNFFDNSFVSITDNGRFWDYNTSKYTAYSNSYTVDVYNESTGAKQNFIKLKQPMNIVFTHDLGENVGIYKVEGNQLKYLHTVVYTEDYKYVYTEIPAGKYYGGTYVLLADENINKVKDIKLNWNYDGLDTYNRRGWLPVTSTGYAKPDTNITRAQLAFMLEKNMNKSNTIVDNSVKLVDVNKNNAYANSINYCVSKGYFTVGSDNKFRPNDTVSYAEMEIILQRVLKYNLPFSTIDASMQNTAFHKSKYASNKKSPITISEAVYSLMYVFQ